MRTSSKGEKMAANSPIKAAADTITDLEARGYDSDEIDWHIRERFPALGELDIHRAFDMALGAYRDTGDGDEREIAALSAVVDVLEGTGCRTLADAADASDPTAVDMVRALQTRVPGHDSPAA